MTRSYEPDADRQLEDGDEPPFCCPQCGTVIDADEYQLCETCADEEQLAAFDEAHPVMSYEDEEAEAKRNY